MHNSIRFEDLAGPEREQEENTGGVAKGGMEVTIDVAGPQEVESKTICLSLDVRGLIKLQFKEGGQLPRLLAGRFTNLTEVTTALAEWQSRRNKEFKLDPTITAPHSKDGANSLDDLVKEQIDQGATPKFPDTLDPALVAAEEAEGDQDGSPIVTVAEASNKKKSRK